MIEFFFVLSLVGGGLFGLLVALSFRKWFTTSIEEPVEQKADDITIIARSVNDVVGKYQDSTIYRYVQAKDGKMYTFESIAVEVHPGVYHGDHPDKNYIIVDKCLLYREVPAS
jgi:hypothetical protein